MSAPFCSFLVRCSCLVSKIALYLIRLCTCNNFSVAGNALVYLSTQFVSLFQERFDFINIRILILCIVISVYNRYFGNKSSLTVKLGSPWFLDNL